MQKEQADRLALLRQQRVPIEIVNKLWGLYLAKEDKLHKAYQFWCERRNASDSWANGTVHRARLELFFQANDYVPRHIAAIRLGMDDLSLDRIIEKLDEQGFTLFVPEIRTLVFAGIEDRITEVFADEFRGRVFSSQSDKSRYLHQVLRTQLGVAVQEVLCVTAKQLHENDLAFDFDVVTLEPIGLRYRVWLDLGKPLNLPPDCCSMLFYARNQTELRELVIGGPPTIPASLAA